jgi:hypothetical protein
MAPKGELVITLTSEEVEALKPELQKLTAQSGTPKVEALKRIQAKLKAAEEKML